MCFHKRFEFSERFFTEFWEGQSTPEEVKVFQLSLFLEYESQFFYESIYGSKYH